MALSKILESIQVVYLGTKNEAWQQALLDKGVCLCSADSVDALLSWSYDMDETLVHIRQSYTLIIDDEDLLKGKPLQEWMEEKYQAMGKGFTVIMLRKAGIAQAGLEKAYFTYADPTLLYNKILEIWLKQLNKKRGEELYKVPFAKRGLDILLASILLILLSPLLLVVALLIKLESRGPLFYAAPRIGRNYEVFPFYKFRSMRVNADSLVKDLGKENQYQVLETGKAKGPMEELIEPWLIHDDGSIIESANITQKQVQTQNTYFKLKRDPRVTRVGAIIRKLSIDEIPQLWNVIRGDMSIVGNRPLPAYEAEKLTADLWILRFLAPAGITGLWQVTDRGKRDACPMRRKLLDVEYALRNNLLMDIKIMLSTFSAVLRNTDG